MVIWFLGKSASGKTFFGEKLYNVLRVNCPNIVFFDGDLLRKGISNENNKSAEEIVDSIVLKLNKINILY